MSKLALRSCFLLKKQGYSTEDLLEEVRQLYLRQVDFTQDLFGFFMLSEDGLFDTIWEYGKLIGMEYASEYN